MTADDALFSGLAALGAALRAGALSPVELVEASLARAAADRLGAFVTVTAERAREQARAAAAELAERRWRGPLHGIPFGLVDAIDTRGVPTTYGAAPLRDRVPARDATVAARLAEGGAILVGKLSTIELGGALGCTSAAAAISGPARSPWDRGRWAGACSGPAAAVAAGIVPFAIGADTVGGLAGAAAYCGATGLRPSYGVLSRHGLLPAAYTLDAVGPFARSAADCAGVLSALAGADPRDPSSLAAPPGLERIRPEIPRGLRVALLPFPDEAGARGAARDALLAAADVLRGAGALVSEAALPQLPYDDVARLILEAEAANAFEELVRSGGTRALADPLHRARTAADYLPRATSADYVRAMRLRAEAQRALARFFERHDLVLAANRPAGPPLLDAPPGPLGGGDPLAAAASLAGLPVLALPAGFAGPIPLSVQLAAPPLEEARLLSAATLFQSRTSHHLARPEPEPAVAAR